MARKKLPFKIETTDDFKSALTYLRNRFTAGSFYHASWSEDKFFDSFCKLDTSRKDQCHVLEAWINSHVEDDDTTLMRKALATARSRHKHKKTRPMSVRRTLSSAAWDILIELADDDEQNISGWIEENAAKLRDIALNSRIKGHKVRYK